MKFNENLQELWLGSNHLGPEDGQHLGSILRTNHTLRILDVRDNNLQDSGVRYICAGIAEQMEGLHILNLTSNNIGHEGFHHVSAMLVSGWWCTVWCAACLACKMPLVFLLFFVVVVMLWCGCYVVLDCLACVFLLFFVVMMWLFCCFRLFTTIMCFIFAGWWFIFT